MPTKKKPLPQKRTEHDTKLSVIVFTNDMIAKLMENQHKRHWSNSTSEYLFQRLQEEVEELHEALHHKNKVRDIIRECADVANFAMMIADNLHNQRKAYHDSTRSR